MSSVEGGIKFKVGDDEKSISVEESEDSVSITADGNVASLRQKSFTGGNCIVITEDKESNEITISYTGDTSSTGWTGWTGDTGWTGWTGWTGESIDGVEYSGGGSPGEATEVTFKSGEKEIGTITVKPGANGNDGKSVDSVEYSGGSTPGEATTVTFKSEGTAIGSVTVQPGQAGATGWTGYTGWTGKTGPMPSGYGLKTLSLKSGGSVVASTGFIAQNNFELTQKQISAGNGISISGTDPLVISTTLPINGVTYPSSNKRAVVAQMQYDTSSHSLQVKYWREEWEMGILISSTLDSGWTTITNGTAVMES